MRKFHVLFALFLLFAGVEHLAAQWIQPAQYQEMLGSGIDVDWWTGETDYSNLDWDATIADFHDAGIQHIRITLSNDVMLPEDFLLLDRQVNLCIHHGIIPIIAYKPHFAAGMAHARRHAHMTSWWRTMAEHYRDYPARLSFDILLEPNASLFATTALLNSFYEDCVATIRHSNPRRILFIAPTYNSDPLYLQYLRIPSRANGYLMAEWHFLSRANYDRAWNNWQRRRAYQERWFNERIESALAWQHRTGIYTWVGGWAAGSYYRSADIALQEAFTLFLADALHRAGLPYAVRGVNHFYNYHDRYWQPAAQRPMQTLFRHGSFAHNAPPAAPPRQGQGFSIGGRRFNGQPQNAPQAARQGASQGRQGNPQMRQDAPQGGKRMPQAGQNPNSTQYNRRGNVSSGGNGRSNASSRSGFSIGGSQTDVRQDRRQDAQPKTPAQTNQRAQGPTQAAPATNNSNRGGNGRSNVSSRPSSSATSSHASARQDRRQDAQPKASAQTNQRAQTKTQTAPATNNASRDNGRFTRSRGQQK